MGSTEYQGWPARPERDGLVPMMVLMPEQQRAKLAPMRMPTELDILYDEAMGRFDAFCFWYARPPRTHKGIRDIAQRLESYGSPEALRIAHAVRQALAEAGA